MGCKGQVRVQSRELVKVKIEWVELGWVVEKSLGLIKVDHGGNIERLGDWEQLGVNDQAIE